MDPISAFAKNPGALWFVSAVADSFLGLLRASVIPNGLVAVVARLVLFLLRLGQFVLLGKSTACFWVGF